jgi:hypothetical protein
MNAESAGKYTGRTSFFTLNRPRRKLSLLAWTGNKGEPQKRLDRTVSRRNRRRSRS